MHGPRLATAVVDRGERCELALPADQLGAQTARMPGGVLHDGNHAVGEHRAGLALERERTEGLDVRGFASQAVGLLANQNLARARRLFEPGCDVERVAGRHRSVAARRTRGDLAGVDADVDHESPAEARLELVPDGVQALLHLDGGADGAQGVVLVGDRHPEERDHGIADELLDRAAVGLHGAAHRLEVPQRERPHRLGVERLRDLGRVREIAEEHGHELAALLWKATCQARAAFGAVAGLLGAVRAAGEADHSAECIARGRRSKRPHPSSIVTDQGPRSRRRWISWVSP